ncbi:MAG TPA: NAD(P)H-dependent oxidoreductase [Alloacidobacterium sp.]|nr:NAD(P)H-dependent oxidoreductase [Alloacidobacterium sp.]
MKILHVDASILGQYSMSRQLTASIVDKLRKTNKHAEVIYRDLVAAPPAHMTLATLPGDHPSAAMAGPLDSAAQSIRDDSQKMLDEFLAANTVVIGVPMYNFGIPTQLKAWVDMIVVPGKTFTYSPNGAVGLMGKKRAIVAITRGAAYGPESPFAAGEHAESYMHAVLSFLGITHSEFVIAEGTMAGGEEGRKKARESAQAMIEQLVA